MRRVETLGMAGSTMMTELPADRAPEAAAWRTDPDEDRTDREAGAAFLDEWDAETGEDSGLPSARAMILTSASVTMVAVLGCIAFVAGALWASLHEPDLDYTNIVGEIAIKIGYALFFGALAAAIVVALATAVAGFFVLRHRKRGLQPATPSTRHERSH